MNARPERSLDRKLKRILDDPSCDDFILADAKDADMAFGLAAPGQSPEHHAHEGRFRTLDEYRQLMRDVVRQGLVDILLMSASSNEQLTIRERLFDASPITPAVRANDTSDVHVVTGGAYLAEPSRPFRTATIDHIMCGKMQCEPRERALGADLGLYSVTFNNDLDRDLATLEAYRVFRDEAERRGFRHFLEVFDPNACGHRCPADVGKFVNDMIARTLAGVTERARPVFLKIVYHGPAAMEALAAYDRRLIPGVLGGASGTTFDAFHLLWEAKKYGARAALFGRKINNAEHQLSFIKHLRAIADGQITPREAVRSYHADLERMNIRPYRPLADDLCPGAEAASSYGGGGGGNGSGSGGGAGRTTVAVDGGCSRQADKADAPPVDANGEPDFSTMTPAQKVAWNRARWNRILG